MIRLGEAALQVMGRAGAHQVDGVKNALGHAYGGGAQYFAMWIVSTEAVRTTSLESSRPSIRIRRWPVGPKCKCPVPPK